MEQNYVPLMRKLLPYFWRLRQARYRARTLSSGSRSESSSNRSPLHKGHRNVQARGVGYPQPNKGLLAPRQARNLGIGGHSRKWVVVSQWVRTACQSSLTNAEPAGQERTRVPSRKGPYEAGGSEKAGRVMEPRNVYRGGQRIALKGVSRGKPTVCKRWKAAVLGAVWRVPRTPPGSESGAGLQRGNAGTWESHLSPGAMPGRGDRVTTGPGV